MVIKKGFGIIIFIGLFLGLMPRVYAGSMGTSNAEFLRIAPGAEPAAMGGAYSALAEDVNASFWNPAGLGMVNGSHFSFMHLSWFESMNYEYLAFAQSLGLNHGIGAHIIYFWVPEFNSTGDETGTLLDSNAGKMQDLAISASYGYYLGYLESLRGGTSVGGTVKLIHRQLMDQSEQSLGVDAGLVVETDSGITGALVIQNVSTPIQGEQSPFTVKLGLGYPLTFAAKDHAFRFGADVVKPLDFEDWSDQSWEINLGAEYVLAKRLALRVGYKIGDDLGGVTAGVGAAYNMFQVDYAFVPYELLGYTHRVSISVHLPIRDDMQDRPRTLSVPDKELDDLSSGWSLD